MNENKINGISMIPFGLLAGFADDKEIRITELAENGFQFRTVWDSENVEKFRICFYNDKKAAYHEISVTEFTIQEERKEQFYTVYSVFAEQEEFRKEVQGFAARYSHYIRLKMEEDDSGLAETMTGYPAEKDEIFAESLEQQRKEWFQDVQIGSFSEMEILSAMVKEYGRPVHLTFNSLHCDEMGYLCRVPYQLGDVKTEKVQESTKFDKGIQTETELTEVDLEKDISDEIALTEKCRDSDGYLCGENCYYR